MIHGYLSGLSRPEQVVYFFRQVLGVPVVSKEILNRISEIFGVRLNKRLRGKLATVIDQIEHGHHVFRAYWKSAFLKQYEKYSRYLRNELVSNNLRDFGLKKGLDHLDAVRKRFQIITDRFAGFQAQSLNVHVDFPLLQRLALPVTIGAVRFPGIRIHDTRIIRLLEVLLHGGNTVGDWTARQIHEAVITTFQLSANNYGLNQLRYDLRKLKGHGLLERDGCRYAYRLTAKGVDVALLFLFFHGRASGDVVGRIQPATAAGLNRLRSCLSPDSRCLSLNEAWPSCVRRRVLAVCATKHDPTDESPTPKSVRASPFFSPKAAFMC